MAKNPRDERLRNYANPSHSEWRGSSTRENIDRWASRAKTNSDGADHRASTAKEPTLPDTGAMQVHSTNRTAHMVGDPYAVARGTRNHIGSDYMKSVRRGQS
jgi:hypothetical protein